MELFTLLSYLGGSLSPKKAEEIDEWLKEDPDGSRAALYRDAHDIYDTVVMLSPKESPDKVETKTNEL